MALSTVESRTPDHVSNLRLVIDVGDSDGDGVADSLSSTVRVTVVDADGKQVDETNVGSLADVTDADTKVDNATSLADLGQKALTAANSDVIP